MSAFPQAHHKRALGHPEAIPRLGEREGAHVHEFDGLSFHTRDSLGKGEGDLVILEPSSIRPYGHAIGRPERATGRAKLDRMDEVGPLRVSENCNQFLHLASSSRS